MFSRSTISGLGLTQRHLVGNLKDISQRFGAFAIEAAHRQAQLVDGLDDLVDLLGQNQAGQVQHGADADARAEIGRTGREIAELGVLKAYSSLLLPGRNRPDRWPVQACFSCRPGRNACMRR